MSLIPRIFSKRNDWLDDFFTTDTLVPEWMSRTMTTPAVNVKEDNGQYVVEVAAPGLKKDDFTIKVENDLLSISSEQKEEHEEEKDSFTRKEFSYSSFKRTFSLPKNTNPEKIEAQYEEGVLKITLPKLEIEEPKTTQTIPVS